MKYPVFMPSVWQVDAYSMWWGGRSVRAQPSTAMSCRSGRVTHQSVAVNACILLRYLAVSSCMSLAH